MQYVRYCDGTTGFSRQYQEGSRAGKELQAETLAKRILCMAIVSGANLQGKAQLTMTWFCTSAACRLAQLYASFPFPLMYFGGSSH